MPRVRFESHGGRTLEVSAPEGGRFLDVCDEGSAPVPLSCRSGTCGMCRIDVLEGADLLEPPSADELELLERFRDDPARRRLACQARIRAGEGRVRVRAVTG